jgi:Flp pilus assembly protein TadG
MARVWRAALSARRFVRGEDGSITVFGMFLTLCLVALGGVAIDVQRLQTRTTLMQNTADSAAYTAMIYRPFTTEAAATAAAVSNAAANMPTGLFGQAVATTDVEWGTWNSTTRTFTVQPGSTSAVRVTVRQTTARSNPFRNVVMRLFGLETADAVRKATVAAFGQGCLREGFVSQQRIDIQSNNTFRRGFCIHSNSGVKISSNGIFEGAGMVNGVMVPGVMVTMPDSRTTDLGGNLQLPSSGFSSNAGLQDAVTSNSFPIYLLTQTQRIIDSVSTSPGSSVFVPSYIPAANRTVQNWTGTRNLNTGTLTAGNIYRISCTGNQKIDIANDAVITGIVLITNCQVRFGNGAAWESSLLLSTNADPTDAVTGASGARLGVADGCASGGGSQIITLGGVKVPSGMTVYGGQIVAQGNISFSAGGDGVRGVSLVAGGTISGTSNMEMQSCNGSGMDGNIVVPYARLVE